MKPQKRWMKSVIATSQQEMPALPFRRGNRAKVSARVATQPARLLRQA